MAKKTKNIKFTTYLAIISLLGYLTILLKSAFGTDIQAWVDSSLFLLIGLSLFIGGGYRLIFTYFKNGLTYEEINKIVAVVLGAVSMLIGILTTPLLNIQYVIIDAVKIFISLIAIFVIILQIIGDKK